MDGACQKNCPAGAITVESGVGCLRHDLYGSPYRAKRGHLRGGGCCGEQESGKVIVTAGMPHKVKVILFHCTPADTGLGKIRF